MESTIPMVECFHIHLIEDLKISPITFDKECSYLHIKLDKNTPAVKHPSNIRNFIHR